MVLTSVVSSLDGFDYGISPEGRRPGGGIDLHQVVRDRVLADEQFLQILVEGYSSSNQIEIFLSLIRPSILEIVRKIDYAENLHREIYPDPNYVKTGDHFASLSEADAYFSEEVTKDAQFIIAVWNYMTQSVLPELAEKVSEQMSTSESLQQDLKLAGKIIRGEFSFSKFD